MANVIRSAKSGTHWGGCELLAYNITISPVTPHEFFFPLDPLPTLPLNFINPSILNAAPDGDHEHLSNAISNYLGYLSLASKPTQDSVIDNFAAETLKLLGFNGHNTFVMMGFTVPFVICGDNDAVAEIDVCLLHRTSLILLVLINNKTVLNEPDPEAQVVAQAIATFQFNNRKRGEYGLPPLETMTIPCITMAGTRPTFYLVPVTRGLINAIHLGEYPRLTQTQVVKCVTLGANARNTVEGMENTHYRELVFRRLLAFKMLAKRHWEEILIGL